MRTILSTGSPLLPEHFQWIYEVGRASERANAEHREDCCLELRHTTMNFTVMNPVAGRKRPPGKGSTPLIGQSMLFFLFFFFFVLFARVVSS